jgi:UDP-glucose 6-dehydrogenase
MKLDLAIWGSKVIVEKSTVPVRTCESLYKTLPLNGAQLGSFSVASNPEFLREGTAVTDFLYPDRIVVCTLAGADHHHQCKERGTYQACVERVLGDEISFINAVANIAESVGADVLERVRSMIQHPIVIDGRNLYKAEQMADVGFKYHSIGRAMEVPEHMSPWRTIED